MTTRLYRGASSLLAWFLLRSVLKRWDDYRWITGALPDVGHPVAPIILPHASTNDG